MLLQLTLQGKHCNETRRIIQNYFKFMNPDSINFKTISNDSDTYLLTYTVLTEQNEIAVFQILSDATRFRINEIVENNNLNLLGLSVKVDLFDFNRTNTGYIEIDTLHSSISVTSFEAYLYTNENVLKGKASCTFHYQTMITPPEL